MSQTGDYVEAFLVNQTTLYIYIKKTLTAAQKKSLFFILKLDTHMQTKKPKEGITIVQERLKGSVTLDKELAEYFKERYIKSYTRHVTYM